MLPFYSARGKGFSRCSRALLPPEPWTRLSGTNKGAGSLVLYAGSAWDDAG